jgi:hypothetical protein
MSILNNINNINNNENINNSAKLELPIDELIGNPFYAAINAQKNIGILSLKFLNDLGFKNSESNQIAYLAFNTLIPEISENGSIIEKPYSIKLPILSIINIPNFYFSKISVDFDLEITQKDNNIIYGNILSQSEKSRSLNNYPSYKFKIEAINDNTLPPGLQKTLNMFDNLIPNNLEKISTEYLKKTKFMINNVININPGEKIEFQINQNLLDLEYVYNNKNKYIGKYVDLSGIEEDESEYYNGKTSILDIKFLDKNKKMVINNHNLIEYMYLTIDKKHFKVNINKNQIEEINAKIHDINSKLNGLNTKVSTPLKYCNDIIISNIDETLNLNQLEFSLNSFEGSNKDRYSLEKKIKLALDFINKINNEIQILESSKVELLNQKQIILNKNNINNILTKDRVSRAILTH